MDTFVPLPHMLGFQGGAGAGAGAGAGVGAGTHAPSGCYWQQPCARLPVSKYPGRTRIDVGLSDDEDDAPKAPVPAPAPPAAKNPLEFADAYERLCQDRKLRVLMTLADVDLISMSDDAYVEEVRAGALQEGFETVARTCELLRGSDNSSPYGPSTWLAVLHLLCLEFDVPSRRAITIKTLCDKLADTIAPQEVSITLDTVLPLQREQLLSQSSVLRMMLVHASK